MLNNRNTINGDKETFPVNNAFGRNGDGVSALGFALVIVIATNTVGDP